MQVRQGNIWDELGKRRIVVTTNIGWHPRTYRNNMGAGTVLEASLRWPWLPEAYGLLCSGMREDMPVVSAKTVWLMAGIMDQDDLGPYVPAESVPDLLFFPVKPLLDQRNPEMSWNQLASLELIERSAAELATHDGEIALTLAGAGNGGLDPRRVFDVLSRHLKDSRFLLVDHRLDWEAPSACLTHARTIEGTIRKQQQRDRQSGRSGL